MAQTLKARFRDWLIGHKVAGITVEMTVSGYDEMKAKLKETEVALARLQKAADRLERSLQRISKLLPKGLE